ncbi:MAG: NPCBM/NEW2 domain-containing protein, partial [Planctomycetales bacterium]|nr:NPCBM/NEW2 domain-containing protein [Planctomycetales bacterium]
QEELRLATSGGLKFQIPFAALDEVDYSFGKVVYLSDLQPVGVQWLPRIDLPDSAQLISQYGLPRQNQSFDGSTLSLLWPNEAKPEIRAKDSIKIYSKGLALRSRTILKYRLPPQMQRFSAIAGIDPATVAHGNVFLEISSGNKILWQGEISGAASPVEIQFDLGGVQQLGILVDYGDNLDFGDRLHLVEARVTK